MTDFQEKNERSRKAHATDPRAYREGRAARRAWATKGAFGRLAGSKEGAACARGTSASYSVTEAK